MAMPVASDPLELPLPMIRSAVGSGANAPPVRAGRSRTWPLGRRAAGLIAESSQGSPQQWSIVSDKVIIGRRPAPGVLVIDDEQVSAVHAKITWDGTHYYFEDLSPRNPTLINDRRFTGSHRLENGDRLLLGGTVVAFRYMPNA
jgi:pSer/pThr/pTyr-binding forkhead associated (FHA) protein